ncbi:hypothetical protein O9992_27900 [Vibrio lentus]|nr:hypothetical protein [Vibrio lentus]
MSDGTDVVAANIDLKVEFVNDAHKHQWLRMLIEARFNSLHKRCCWRTRVTKMVMNAASGARQETNDPNASIVDTRWYLLHSDTFRKTSMVISHSPGRSEHELSTVNT